MYNTHNVAHVTHANEPRHAKTGLKIIVKSYQKKAWLAPDKPGLLLV